MPPVRVWEAGVCGLSTAGCRYGCSLPPSALSPAPGWHDRHGQQNPQTTSFQPVPPQGCFQPSQPGGAGGPWQWSREFLSIVRSSPPGLRFPPTAKSCGWKNHAPTSHKTVRPDPGYLGPLKPQQAPPSSWCHNPRSCLGPGWHTRDTLSLAMSVALWLRLDNKREQ